MRYLIDTAEKIDAINSIEAAGRGCSGTTTAWYSTRVTADGKTCMMITDDKHFAGDTDVEPEWPVAESN